MLAEKAMIVVKAVRNSIKITLTKFEEFLQILSEQKMTKLIVDGLRSIHHSKLSCPDLLTHTQTLSAQLFYSKKWFEIIAHAMLVCVFGKVWVRGYVYLTL